MDSPEFVKDPAQIRSEIDSTRESLTEKLQELESNVRLTMDEARANVQEKVERVKESLSVSHYVRQRPVGLFCGAVGLGFLMGRALTRPAPIPATPVIEVHERPLRDFFDEELQVAMITAADAIWSQARTALPPHVSTPLNIAFDRFASKFRRQS